MKEWKQPRKRLGSMMYDVAFAWTQFTCNCKSDDEKLGNQWAIGDVGMCFHTLKMSYIYSFFDTHNVSCILDERDTHTHRGRYI